MAIKKRHIKAVIQLRRATEQEWVNRDPILRLGEPALSTDVYKLKIGDGHTKWSLIPYLSTGEGISGVDYLQLINKPSINNFILRGNVQSLDLGIKTSDLINDKHFISLEDNLIFDCGTSTTNI